MKVYNIVLQNQIINRKPLTNDIIKKYLENLKKDGIIRKYPLNIFYTFSSCSNKNNSLQEDYQYGLKNIKIFLECEEKYKYSSNDINNFSILFTLKSHEFNLENYQEGVDFINNNFIKYSTNNKLSQWFQEEIELFKLNLLSFDVENYKNGNVQNMLNELEEIIPVHKDTLIYEVEENYDEY